MSSVCKTISCIVLVFLPIISITGYAQFYYFSKPEDYAHTLKRYDLNGPVHRVEESYTVRYSQGSRLDPPVLPEVLYRTVWEFDRQGLMTAQIMYEDSMLMHESIAVHDSLGRLISFQTLEPYPDALQLHAADKADHTAGKEEVEQYFYDSEGRLTEFVLLRDGNLDHRIRYRYEPDFLEVTRQSIVEGDTVNCLESRIWQGDEDVREVQFFHCPPLTGKGLDVLHYTLIRTVDMLYSSEFGETARRLTDSIIMASDGSSTVQRALFSMDGKLRQHSIDNHADRLCLRDSYRYNDIGDVVWHSQANCAAKKSERQFERDQVTTIRYEYDEYDNWVVKETTLGTVSLTRGDSSIVRRTISYYE